MTLPLAFAQFADHLVGRGTIATFSGPTRVTAGGKFYFEATVISASASQTLVGIGNSTFTIINPTALDVSPPDGPGFAGAAVLAFRDNGLTPVGRGYPSNINASTTTTFTASDTVGIAVDTINSKLWWRNATSAPSTWWGDNGGGSQDPVAGTHGFDFTASTGTTPISGNLYVIAGVGNENTPSAQEITMNFGASSFVASLPTGFTAWGATATTTLNSSDKDSHITLAAGNLHITGATAIAGSNQPTGFVRSTTYKERS